MILRFSIENYRSIWERQELLFAASALRDSARGLIPVPNASGAYALPAAVIYGANASGKSTLVDSFGFMRKLITASYKSGEPGGTIERTPHALDPTAPEKPTIAEADFFLGGTRYQYGFAVNDTAIELEWLNAYPRGRLQKLFSRNKQEFEFSRGLKGRTKVIAELTPPTSLYLSAAAQTGHELLSDIAKFFRSWTADVSINMNVETAKYTLARAKTDTRTLDFLNRIGTGVVEHRIRDEEIEPDLAELVKDFLKLAGTRLKQEFPQSDEHLKKRLVLELAHKARDGKVVFFDLAKESDGTRRLLKLLGLAFDALDHGSLLIVDELDASLHTQACEEVLALFCDRETNPKGAQLVATTHDTNLLDSEFLRRDQVWFAQKDDEGATTIYPLTDIRTRSTDAIAKGYLQGRYGAVPTFGRSKVRSQ